MSSSKGEALHAWADPLDAGAVQLGLMDKTPVGTVWPLSMEVVGGFLDIVGMTQMLMVPGE